MTEQMNETLTKSGEEEERIRDEGYGAFMNGKSEKDNPYQSTPRKNWWAWGFEDAQTYVWDYEWAEWQAGRTPYD